MHFQSFEQLTNALFYKELASGFTVARMFLIKKQKNGDEMKMEIKNTLLSTNKKEY